MKKFESLVNLKGYQTGRAAYWTIQFDSFVNLKELQFGGYTVQKLKRGNAISKETKTNIIWNAALVIIAVVSFFGVGKWATSIETYSKTIESLGELKNHALEMTSGATLLATAAAAVPTETLTPLANKLMDVAGYMVIVYIAITLEKYLLTLMSDGTLWEAQTAL